MTKLEKITLRITYFDMKMWSRMFAVNVHSVSIQQVNWHIISQCTLTTDSFAVVYVVKTLNINQMLNNTLRNVLIGLDVQMFGLAWSNVILCNSIQCVCYCSVTALNIYLRTYLFVLQVIWDCLPIIPASGGKIPVSPLLHLHRESNKGSRDTLVHIFAKYWPIFTILSPTYSVVNLQ